MLDVAHTLDVSDPWMGIVYRDDTFMRLVASSQNRVVTSSSWMCQWKLDTLPWKNTDTHEEGFGQSF